ncbi:MAG: FmdB family zinc ribbon protein [Calditrichia bacterium]
MPTYEYLCKDCGHKFDEFQSISAKALTKCPVCKGKVERLISGGTGLIFKGSGFYITDYTNKSGSTSTKKSESKPVEKKSKPTTKKDSDS